MTSSCFETASFPQLAPSKCHDQLFLLLPRKCLFSLKAGFVPVPDWCATLRTDEVQI